MSFQVAPTHIFRVLRQTSLGRRCQIILSCTQPRYLSQEAFTRKELPLRPFSKYQQLARLKYGWGDHFRFSAALAFAHRCQFRMTNKWNPLHSSIHNASIHQEHPALLDILHERSFHTSSVVSLSEIPENETPTPSDNDPSLAWTKSGKNYTNGPDQILPSSAIYTWHTKGAVQLSKLGKGKLADLPPMSVPTFLQSAVERSPDRTALAVKRNGIWEKWSYKQYQADVRTAAKGFIALGLERYGAVAILGFNSPEWFIADLGAISAGGFAAGIYTTNTAEACAYVAIDCKANIIVVEDEGQLEKVLKYRSKMRNLKAIVQYSGEPKKQEGLYSWAELMKLGSEQSDEKLEERLKLIAVNQCCTLIYTSGTTGNPKGVMLSHDNCTWLARVCKVHCNFRDCEDEGLSFLPLSHVAAQMGDIYCMIACSGSAFFCDNNALKGTLIDTMREIKPTKFLAVPRVFESMADKMQDAGRQSSPLVQKISSWAKNQGWETNLKRSQGVQTPETFQFKIADKLIFSKLKKVLGLERCDFQVAGAAPISPEVLKYFWSLNIVVTEGYGMSECGGPHTVATPSNARFGSVGLPMDGTGTKLNQVGKDGSGEVCMGGRHIFMGYIHLPEKTKDAIDEEGWLHSEDIGRIDEDGYIYITGRLKELLITAGGENIAPVPIEDNVKAVLPIVSQAMLIGDKLKFLSILLTLKTEVNKDTGEPLDTLVPHVKEWIEKNGDCKVTTVSDVRKEVDEKGNQKLVAAIEAGIKEANQNAISRAQKIQKWTILPKDFSIPGGEFGPSLKLKRHTVMEKYQSVVDQLYKN